LSLKYPYKAFPIATPNPAFPKYNVAWRPALNVSIFYKRTRTTPIQCILDTGSTYCLFRADVGEAVGIDVRAGKKYDLGGISQQMKVTFYFHAIKLYVAACYIEIMAGFSYELPMAGLLGHLGFFDHFIVTFDNTPHPPTFEVQQIARH